MLILLIATVLADLNTKTMMPLHSVYSGPSYESLRNFSWHLKEVCKGMDNINTLIPAYIDSDKEVDLFIFSKGKRLKWFNTY